MSAFLALKSLGEFACVKVSRASLNSQIASRLQGMQLFKFQVSNSNSRVPRRSGSSGGHASILRYFLRLPFCICKFYTSFLLPIPPFLILHIEVR